MNEKEYQLKNLYIYTTWNCNLKCKHCWVSADYVSHHNTTVDPALVLKAIERAGLHGLERIKISGGEPCLSRENILAIINKAHTLGVAVDIETNGTLITEDFLKELDNTKVVFNISVDSAYPNKHDYFRGVRGSFQKMESGMRLLRQHNFRVGITHAVHRSNIDEIDKMIEYTQKAEITDLKLNPVMCLGRGKDLSGQDEPGRVFMFSAEELIGLLNRYCIKKSGTVSVHIMLPYAFSAFKVFLQKEKTNRYGTCPTLNLLSILPDGDVGLCGEAKDMEELQFGSLLEAELDEIWLNNKKLNQLRESIPHRLEGVCGRCLVKDSCLGSCRVVALAKGGKINAPSPVCQEIEDKGKFFLYNNKKQ